jgi:sugar lactone lactonase YvrE
VTGGPGSLTLLHEGGSFFESPRWHEDRWWVSDMFGHRVTSVTTDGEATDVHVLTDRPSGIGWLPDGRMLIVLMGSRTIAQLSRSGELVAYAALGSLGRGHANDMVIDRHGRAWVGSLGFDLAVGERPVETDLVCVHPNGTIERAARGLLTPNGAVILSDGCTLVVAETFASRLTSFRIGDDGTLSDRAVWAQLAPPPPSGDLRSVLRALRVAPDGLAVDSEDCVWYADAAGGGCVRVARDGVVKGRVPAPPGLNIFACALGGSTGATLLMCCSPDAVESRRTAAAESALFITEVDVPGL